MKLYPAVFIVLFIKNKKWRAILQTALFTALLTLLAMLIIGATKENLAGLKINLALFDYFFQVYEAGMPHSHSLFALIRFPLFVALTYGEITIKAFGAAVVMMQKPYMVFTLALFAFLAAHIVFVEKIFWKKLFLLAFAATFLPFVSFDYTLIILIVPLLFLFYEKPAKDDWTLLVLYSMLCAPLNFYVWIWMEVEVNTGVLLRPLIAILMVALIISRPHYLNTFKNGVKAYFRPNYDK
jgi:hypothetical protein